jgi:hypothetical protein
MPRLKARLDDNQHEIVDALRSVGVWVTSTASMGHGFPDLLCARKRFFLVEIKDGSKPPCQRKLTEDEVKFHAKCPLKIYIVENIEQAMLALMDSES